MPMPRRRLGTFSEGSSASDTAAANETGAHPDPPRRLSSLVIRLLAALVATLGIMHALTYASLFSLAHGPTAPAGHDALGRCVATGGPLEFRAVRRIDARDYNDQRQLMDALLDSAEPAVVENLSALQQWAAFERWRDRDYLIQHAPNLANVMLNSTHGSTFLYYNREKALLRRTAGLTLREPTALANMSSSEFFQRADRGDGLYYSSSVSSTSDTLSNDIGSYSALVRASRLPVRGPNIWLGSASVTARLHYDASDNLYTQVSGRKRFRLFSPRHAFALYEFSTLHPASRQSQMDIDQPGVRLSGDFPLFFDSGAACDGREALLGPGDLLIIPAFWFHHVTAITPLSVSVNGFLQTNARQTIAKAYRERVPIQPYWLPRQRQAAARVYIHALVRRFFALKSSTDAAQRARKFIFRLLTARYAHFHVDPLLDGPSLHTLSPPSSRHEHLFWPQYCSGTETEFGPEDARVLRVAAETVAVLFLQLKPDMRELALADYIEEVISAIIDSGEEVGRILHMCFVMKEPPTEM